jgi:hypothetical protein
MTRRIELEGAVRSWLREDGHEDADRVLDLVLAELDTTPQRHVSWLARRFPIMNSSSFRYGIAAVVVIAAALLGATLLPGTTGRPDPTRTPVPSGPAASAQPLTGTTSLAPGAYFIHESFPMRITFTVPSDGWQHYVWESGAAANNTRALCSGGPDCEPPDAAGVGFHLVTGVPADPCDPGSERMEIGETIEELAAAIADRPGWDATEPTPTTVAGFPAVSFELRAQPGDIEGCAGGVTAFYAGALGRGATSGERLRLWVVDVNGSRLTLEAFDFSGTPDEDVDAATQIIESVGIEAFEGSGAGGIGDGSSAIKPGKRTR